MGDGSRREEAPEDEHVEEERPIRADLPLPAAVGC